MYKSAAYRLGEKVATNYPNWLSPALGGAALAAIPVSHLIGKRRLKARDARITSNMVNEYKKQKKLTHNQAKQYVFDRMDEIYKKRPHIPGVAVETYQGEMPMYAKFSLTKSEERPDISLPTVGIPHGGTYKPILDHELGHLLDYDDIGMKMFKNDTRLHKLFAGIIPTAFMPRYRAERRAWDKGGVSKSDPKRKMQLKTHAGKYIPARTATYLGLPLAALLGLAAAKTYNGPRGGIT